MESESEAALVRAAAAAFARDGYQGASLNDILRTAGWAKSSLYHYFGSKKALHDHVVSVLAGRLGEGVTVPNLDSLTAADFWPSMAGLLDDLARAAHRHPETRQLGLMFHGDDTAETDSALGRLRAGVTAWLTHAVRRGLALGLIRRDVPADLVVDLTGTVLGVLDRWALDGSMHSPAGPDAGRLSLRIVYDLIAVHDPAGPPPRPEPG